MSAPRDSPQFAMASSSSGTGNSIGSERLPKETDLRCKYINI